MTVPEIIAAARAEIVALEPNPICGETHAAKLLRQDALAIFDKMAAEVGRKFSNLHLALLAEKREAGEMILDAAMRAASWRALAEQTAIDYTTGQEVD